MKTEGLRYVMIKKTIINSIREWLRDMKIISNLSSMHYGGIRKNENENQDKKISQKDI